jgi:hypothetical protein
MSKLDELMALADAWCQDGYGNSNVKRDALESALKALVEDAERYQWLKLRNPEALCVIAWGKKPACKYNEPDAAIDAARKA